MQRLPQRRLIDSEVPCYGVDAEQLRHTDTVDGAVDLVEQGQHIAGSARITLGHTMGKEKARGRLRHNARFTAKLSRAIALPFDAGGRWCCRSGLEHIST